VADAKWALNALSDALEGVVKVAPARSLRLDWEAEIAQVTAKPTDASALPTDMQVVGAVQRSADASTVVMGAAGTMPGELHKLWHAQSVGGYHMEYGYSCMGYEIAGALGIKMAQPQRNVIAMVGDGS
jgi:3D-(3,5/4)-trihydroxycyclohexane-1,2-dione acylhydrolase (decyclizing)